MYIDMYIVIPMRVDIAYRYPHIGAYIYMHIRTHFSQKMLPVRKDSPKVAPVAPNRCNPMVGPLAQVAQGSSSRSMSAKFSDLLVGKGRQCSSIAAKSIFSV